MVLYPEKNKLNKYIFKETTQFKTVNYNKLESYV